MKQKNYKENYPDGIDSNFWQQFVSPMIIFLKGGKCERCGSAENLDCHHESYDGELTINTIKVLCRSCHKLGHNTNKS